MLKSVVFTSTYIRFTWNYFNSTSEQLFDNDEALESEALCFLFQRWWHIYDFLWSISEFRSHQASSYGKIYIWWRDLRSLHFDERILEYRMDENFINLIFNPLFLFTAAKLAYPRSSNQKETAGHDENWYFGVHPFFRGHLDTYPWSSFQSDSFFFLCFFLRNLVACRIDLETAGWDSPMKNWSLGVENMICHVECSYSTKISSSSFFLI